MQSRNVTSITVTISACKYNHFSEHNTIIMPIFDIYALFFQYYFPYYIPVPSFKCLSRLLYVPSFLRGFYPQNSPSTKSIKKREIFLSPTEILYCRCRNNCTRGENYCTRGSNISSRGGNIKNRERKTFSPPLELKKRSLTIIFYSFSPYIRSPASPRPGTMYLRSLRIGSMAAV